MQRSAGNPRICEPRLFAAANANPAYQALEYFSAENKMLSSHHWSAQWGLGLMLVVYEKEVLHSYRPYFVGKNN